MTAFSVLLPIYHKDRPSHLRSAVESVLSQSARPAEIVLVVDGPIGLDLEGVIDQYSATSPVPVVVLRNSRNMGLGYALNVGLERCQFDIVARMDADDVCAEGRFERQLSVLLADPGLAVVGGAQHEFRECVGDCKRIKWVPAGVEKISRVMRYRNPMNHPTVMFRASCVRKVGGYMDFYLLEDYFLWYRLIRAGFRLDNLPLVVLYARTGNGMVARRRGWRYFMSEQRLHSIMRADGFLLPHKYWACLFGKFLARLAPIWVLDRVYLILRSYRY